MGVCASCLGLGRRNSQSENTETSRLLSDDPYRSHYGSHVPIGQRSVYQPDPESLKREREALENICHAMSDNVIDVFTSLPQPVQQGMENHAVSPPLPLDETANYELSLDELKYKTVKRSRAGPLVSTLGKDIRSWKAVKDAMG